MIVSTPRTKLIVADVDACERFYVGMGLLVVRHLPITGNLVAPLDEGRNMTRAKQCWVSQTGDETSHIIILSQLLDYEPTPTPRYPGEAWLLFRVTDVDETVRTAEALGGSTVIPAKDSERHPVRAAVIADVEGHRIEIVGPRVGP